nr:cytochrome-c oxidase, cbb3-type subunit I [Bremerella cremea]
MPADNSGSINSGHLETFSYDDKITRQFLTATVIWGMVAFLVGLFVAAELVIPNLSLGLEFLTFGRLRPLHTNAAIFAFAGNSIFAAIYYSTQRLLKTRMWSDTLSQLHFWGWQLIIVFAAVTLPLGITQSREYAELEWPIDILIALVWAGFFGVNFFMTLVVRRERHIYVAIWFYIATIITVAILHIFNNLVFPTGIFKSYSIYAGVQDAFMQWWYGHNAVAFFLTTPFLGLMYYFLPKAANRPIFSYKLSILHFWSLVFIYIWAGPHHLHYTALPEWASSLGMIFSIMLWMPSWGGMINGLLTLRGAWRKVTEDPVLKFFVVGITFYGMSTFEGPMLSVKAVNSLSHYTDWTIAHVHSGALGWNGFMTFGMIYWLLPRVFQTQLYSKKLAEWHFWLGLIGILLYIIPIYGVGVYQGLLWFAMNDQGQLMYPNFIQTTENLAPFYIIRVLGGLCYFAGGMMLSINVWKTWAARPAVYEVPEYQAAPLSKNYVEHPLEESKLAQVLGIAKMLDVFTRLGWHRNWEGRPLYFSVWVAIAVIVASLFEIIPTFMIRSNVPTIASVQPYTPLEIAGRDIYVAEGCYNCHSQMIRPILAETIRYGEYSKAGEFVYDHPFQWGSRRIGPDLAREGGRQSSAWHVFHFRDPGEFIPGSIMPAYPHFEQQDLNLSTLPERVKAAYYLGAPYSDEELENSIEIAQAQAKQIAKDIADQNGPEGLENKKVVALIAYIQRLGVDLFKSPPPSAEDEEPTAANSDEVARTAEEGEAK